MVLLVNAHRSPSSSRPGLLRRLFASLRERCRITAADMPPREPAVAAHWELEPQDDAALPEVTLPRTAATARPTAVRDFAESTR